MTDTEWYSFLIALAIVGTMGTIITVLILKYVGEKLDKPLATLASLFGTVLGSIGTYFFTREQVADALRQKKETVEATESERRSACDSAVRQLLNESDETIQYFREDFQSLYDDFLTAQAELERLRRQVADGTPP
jgi:uncharacterized protein (DUF3084 family)